MLGSIVILTIVRIFSSSARWQQQHFTHKEITWYAFMLEAEWTSGLINADATSWQDAKFSH
jgi:hypothetical protein